MVTMNGSLLLLVAIIVLVGMLSVPMSGAFAPTTAIVVTRSPTRLFSSTDENFMASLQRRMDEVSRKDATLPLIVLDSMLPRQVLNITVNNGLLMELVRTRLQEETPRLGMVGTARLADGRRITLSSGVEVELEGVTMVPPKQPSQPAAAEDRSSPEKRRLQLSLRGTRCFRVVEGTVETTEQGWTQAQIDFLNSTLDDTAEASSSSSSSSTDSDSDPLSLARAMQMAREFTDPNFSMAESKSLVDTWLDLARHHERRPGQIDQLLEDLGPMPEWKEPTDCALWVGALINPIPALGVALEIRPQLLLAKTPETG